MIKTYYRLAKPGIVYGNALPAIGGFLLASRGGFDPRLFVAMLLGLSLVIACGCVLNNYLDRGIDAKMERTKHRAIVTNAISGRSALIYAAILGILGFSLLVFFTNWLAVFAALLGLIFYVVVYGIAKRHTTWSTVVGSISGAVPPVVGYVAVTNTFDIGALIIFLILVAWQMPHFYAIAIFRSDDYAAASIPVLPVKKGIETTKVHMFAYVTAFIIAALALTYFGFTGYAFAGLMALLGAWWLALCIRGFRISGSTENIAWSRKMFRFSLIVLLAFSFALSLNAIVP
jgi:protoheme IX farnesyltransferase